MNGIEEESVIGIGLVCIAIVEVFGPALADAAMMADLQDKQIASCRTKEELKAMILVKRPDLETFIEREEESMRRAKEIDKQNGYT